MSTDMNGNAVFVSQRQMLRQFLEEVGDAYTIDEAIVWCDARTDPQFWRPKQLERALRRYKAAWLGHQFNEMQKAADKARKRVTARAMEQAAAQGKPISEKAAAEKADDPGPVGHVKPRLYRQRKTEEGKRHEYTLLLNLKYEDGCKSIDKELELLGTHGVKAVETYDKLMAELPPADKRRLRERYKHDPRFQQALAFVKESQAV